MVTDHYSQSGSTPSPQDPFSKMTNIELGLISEVSDIISKGSAAMWKLSFGSEICVNDIVFLPSLSESMYFSEYLLGHCPDKFLHYCLAVGWGPIGSLLPWAGPMALAAAWLGGDQVCHTHPSPHQAGVDNTQCREL